VLPFAKAVREAGLSMAAQPSALHSCRRRAKELKEAKSSVCLLVYFLIFVFLFLGNRAGPGEQGLRT
jgi:hypothetical protein